MSLERSQVLSHERLDCILLLEGFQGKFSWLQDPHVQVLTIDLLAQYLLIPDTSLFNSLNRILSLALPNSIRSSCSSIDLVRPVDTLLGMYLLDSTLKNRKTIEKERYELMEYHIHYVASRAEQLHP